MTDRISQAIADPTTFSSQSIYDDLFAELRRDAPVRWTTPEGCRPFWVLSKHADVREIELQPELFLSEPRTELRTIVEEDRIKAETGGRHELIRTMLHMDGDEHRAYRGLTQAWFMPANLRKLEATLAALAKEYVCRMEALGGECNFVKDVSVWYALRVIMMILGLPPEEEPKVMQLTEYFVGRQDTEIVGDAPSDDVVVQGAKEVFAYFAAVLADRRSTPRDDVASVVANAQFRGAPIEDLEALSYYLILALAGHETTSATIAGGVLALIQHPGELAKLRSDPNLIGPAADEMLRWVSPVKHFFRTAAQDYTLRGQKIRAGDGLMMCFPSANRDEEVFEDPFAFRIDRTPNPQMAFGYGAHACLGQHLAKMEIRAFFREWLERVEHAELTAEPAWIATTFAGGLKNLPIRYRMRAPAMA